MTSFQVLVCYLSSAGYIPVVSINAPSMEFILENVFCYMNGQPLDDGVRIRPLVKQALRGTLRSMRVGDAIEISGQTYIVAPTGWDLVEYRKDHQYSVPNWNDPERDDNPAERPLTLELPEWAQH